MNTMSAIEKAKIGGKRPIYKYSVVNVGFINNFGEYDETQLDIYHNLATKQGRQELADLFDSLRIELNCVMGNICSVYIVASSSNENIFNRDF